MKAMKEERIQRYKNAVVELKNLGTFSRTIGEDVAAKNKVARALYFHLCRIGATKRLERGVYEWNEKIPISRPLVLKVIEDIDLGTKQHYERKKLAAKQVKKQVKVDFNFEVPKQVIKPKKEIKQKQVKVKHKREVGIIRRFLRWLY